MRLTWPLTGRAEEARLIEAAVADPDASGIAICGAAGVGKSRIAREALDSAASRGCDVRWVVGTSCARGLPLGALASWATPAGSDSLALVCRVIESLTAASPGTPVVVGVDDAHLLDDLSMFVVHQIVQRRAAKVVLTVRDDEPIPAAIPELWKIEGFSRLELRAAVAGRDDGAAVGDLGRVLGPGHCGPTVETHPRKHAVSAAHRGTGDRRRPTGITERLLAVERRPGGAARPGRDDRIAVRRLARRRGRRPRHARRRRAASRWGTATDHASRRRRGSRRPWPDQARRCRDRDRSPDGAPAVRRGAKEPHGADEAAATAWAGGCRTGRGRRRRRRADRWCVARR